MTSRISVILVVLMPVAGLLMGSEGGRQLRGSARASAGAAAQVQRALLTFSCNAPTGVSVYRYPGAFEQHEDGFSGVRPKFIFDPSRDSELFVLWGDTKLARNIRPEIAERARVLITSGRQDHRSRCGDTLDVDLRAAP